MPGFGLMGRSVVVGVVGKDACILGFGASFLVNSCLIFFVLDYTYCMSSVPMGLLCVRLWGCGHSLRSVLFIWILT
ncbi:hypothetical protein EX30DRAFT_207899 [Ascodesmis nigricans]|uniref:Uncharacterized protein n=1 Tax=Ascodesmis nigricans TaxID=341454 RepID=A0A4S2MJN9_9PEZI|nr:hypothetical protein EX30DRAFT_207899 [Ascodesmis nigricans]